MNPAAEKQKITIEVNPLQTAILMDLMSRSMPEMRIALEIFFAEFNIRMDIDAIEAVINEIYTKCFAESELMEEAVNTFNETGTFPNIAEAARTRCRREFKLVGPGETKEVVIEVIPALGMVTMRLFRNSFRHFVELLRDHYARNVRFQPQVIMDTMDLIYEKCIAHTDTREKIAPIIEVFEMTGRFPNLDEVFGKNEMAN